MHANTTHILSSFQNPSFSACSFFIFFQRVTETTLPVSDTLLILNKALKCPLVFGTWDNIAHTQTRSRSRKHIETK